MENNLPRWSVRLDATRPVPDFSDLVSIVNSHFRVHQSVEQFLGPYNAKQRSSSLPYRAPDRGELHSLVKQGGMNDLSFGAYMAAVIRFCESTKGLRAVPTPHPSTIHSIQLPMGAFELKSKNGATEVHVAGTAEPLIVKGLRDPETVKFIIVRPKLGQLGTASARNWEVLFFREGLGYLPQWADSDRNPRYSGIV